MPDQRAAGKSLVGCHVDARFLAEIDRKRGTKSRSDFLREALYEYLGSTTLPASITAAPDRAGKGGRPRKPLETAMLNDTATDPSQAQSQGPFTYPKGPARKKGKQK